MCILLKLRYPKFGVSSLVFSKVIEEKPLGIRLDPPPPPIGKGKVKGLLPSVSIFSCFSFILSTRFVLSGGLTKGLYVFSDWAPDSSCWAFAIFICCYGLANFQEHHLSFY